MTNKLQLEYLNLLNQGIRKHKGEKYKILMEKFGAKLVMILFTKLI